ncbi:MAG TPA: thiamine pyrophosphate-dependent enzyme, partial [Anaerolineales bacterium]|nr:thiamine pyrophosphate-dependent enzyme [Anaerolineales bacterium]
ELLGAKIDSDKVPVYPSSKYRMTDMGAGDPAWIEEAAELLANSKKPYLHAGKGVLWADAAPEFLELGNYLAAGMGSSMGARGAVPEDHPHYFFLFDMQATTLARNEADVVLVVGSRLGEYDGWGSHPAWGMPEKQKTIQIDVDANVIGLNRPVDVGILADAKSALKAILSKVKEKTAARSEMPDLARYRELSQQTMANGFQFLMAQPTRGLNPGQMVFNARSFFPRNAVTVLDGGNTTLWGVAFNQIYEPRSFLYSVKMGYLGTGIPFAIGAKLAAPGRPVYCITGDGAAGFNIMEMETAVRENAQIIVLVAVDDGWGMERSAHNFGGVPAELQQGVNISTEMRYDLIAQGLGCYAEKVDSVDVLPAALQRAVDSGKPALLHVTVDSAINADPPGYKQFRYVRTL